MLSIFEKKQEGRKKKQSKSKKESSVGLEFNITMNFGVLLSIITFCAGAAFTLVDIGSDSALAFEYWNNSDIVRGANSGDQIPSSKKV